MRTLNQTSSVQTPSFSLFKTDQLPVFLSSSETAPNKPEDIEHCTTLFQKLISSQPELLKKAELLLEEVKEKDYSKGIGYYNSKNLMLLEYLIQLQFYQLFKINGEDLTSGQGLELYKRLAYLKTVLTKLGPVQKKLQYQKNKLLKYSDVVQVKPEAVDTHEDNQEEEQGDSYSSEQGQGEYLSQENAGEQKQIEEESEDDDALAYQPRPQALLNVKHKKKEVQKEQEEKYVPPKMSAVLSREDKRKRKQEIQQQRKKVHLIRKYRNDLEDDEQAREQGVGSHLSEKIKQKFREKTTVEEQNFMRFPETKKEKFWKKSMIRQSERSNPLLDELKDIQRIKEIFTEKEEEPALPVKTLKRKAVIHKPQGGKKRIKRNDQ